VFLLLVIYSLGILWSTVLPKRSRVEGTRFEWLGPALHFVNPGKFRLKEVRLSCHTHEHLAKLSYLNLLARDC
jgi:hypothetical protein